MQITIAVGDLFVQAARSSGKADELVGELRS